MNRERLELMVTMLKELEAGTWKPTGTTLGHLPLARLVPEGGVEFNLNVWADTTDPDHACGFAACAIGHACMDARFNELGLCLFWREGTKTPIYLADQEEWKAVHEFFDLGPELAWPLFDPNRYTYDERRDPAAVRARIETLLLRHSKERR